MRSVPVVEVEISIQRDLHGVDARKVPAAKFDPPVLVEDGALKAFDKAVGPGMTRLGAGVLDAKLRTCVVKGPSEFMTLIGEDPLHRPTRLRQSRHHPLGQEVSRRSGCQAQRDLRHRKGAGRIAGRQLPHLPNALELANEESVQADQFPRLFGLNMLASPSLRRQQLPAGTLGEQARGLSAVGFEHSQCASATDRWSKRLPSSSHALAGPVAEPDAKAQR